MEWSTELMSQSWFQSLYEGATVTVCGAYCSIMQYAIRAKLSYIVSITPYYMSTIKQAPEDTIYAEKVF